MGKKIVFREDSPLCKKQHEWELAFFYEIVKKALPPGAEESINEIYFIGNFYPVPLGKSIRELAQEVQLNG